MKTKTIITEINHEDLVDLLSTSLYGSSMFGGTYNKSEYLNSKPMESDCIEDKMARCLLNGYSITIFDWYAEEDDEHYGTLPFVWDDEECVMCYTVTLKDIEHGLEKAMDAGAWPAKCVQSFINVNDGNFDQLQAETLLQWIIFGEEIYG